MAEKSLAHLERNRPAILERAAVAALVGMVPIPAIDELLAYAVQTTLLRHIAETRHVDVSDATLSQLAGIAVRGSFGVGAASTTRSVGKMLRSRRLKAIVALWNAAGRADDLASTFAVATLFDHYCAQHHVGAGLDEESGRRLVLTVEAAIRDARGATARRGLKRLSDGASRAVSNVPRALAALQQRVPLLAPPAPPILEAEPVAAAAEQGFAAPHGAPGRGFLRRGLDGIAHLLGDAAESWVEELTTAFDARWARALDASR